MECESHGWCGLVLLSSSSLAPLLCQCWSCGRSALVVSWMPGVCIIKACVVPEAVWGLDIGLCVSVACYAGGGLYSHSDGHGGFDVSSLLHHGVPVLGFQIFLPTDRPVPSPRARLCISFLLELCLDFPLFLKPEIHMPGWFMAVIVRDFWSPSNFRIRVLISCHLWHSWWILAISWHVL